MHQDHARTEASARERPRDAALAPRGEPGLQLVYCPECGMPAWVEWRDVVGSTAGAVVHVKVRCFGRHWFLMPEDRLTAA
jgi:hypothetical protein